MIKKLIRYSWLVIALVLVASMLKPKDSLEKDIVKTPMVDTVKIKPIKVLDTIPKEFSFIYTKFKKYNPYVDSSTVFKFSEVAQFYGLTGEKTLEWCVGQILLESGAKQCYQPGHPKEGRLVVSYADAIGISQILPSTAYGYMVKRVEPDEVDCFYGLGATDFSFAYDEELSKVEKIDLAREWLSNETNNIIMWGKIMSSKLKKAPMIDVLIAYNSGIVGLRNYIASGKSKYEHKYITGIMGRINMVK
jgi:hypothetical protein